MNAVSDFFSEHSGWFLLLLFVLLFAGLAVVAKEDSERREKLMAECMADGHREYQCESMLKRPVQNGGVIFMPVGR